MIIGHIIDVDELTEYGASKASMPSLRYKDNPAFSSTHPPITHHPSPFTPFRAVVRQGKARQSRILHELHRSAESAESAYPAYAASLHLPDVRCQFIIRQPHDISVDHPSPCRSQSLPYLGLLLGIFRTTFCTTFRTTFCTSSVPLPCCIASHVSLPSTYLLALTTRPSTYVRQVFNDLLLSCLSPCVPRCSGFWHSEMVLVQPGQPQVLRNIDRDVDRLLSMCLNRQIYVSEGICHVTTPQGPEKLPASTQSSFHLNHLVPATSPLLENLLHRFSCLPTASSRLTRKSSCLPSCLVAKGTAHHSVHP